LVKSGGFLERIAFRLSYSRRLDGLWIGILADRKDRDRYLLERVQDALNLIKQHDPLRYGRIHRDIERIWITIRSAGGVGEFSLVSGICYLDKRFIEKSTPQAIASVIVHEATHGYPCLRKMGYAEKLRYRIERICIGQQLSFARRLPDSKNLCESLERSLKRDPSFWSNSEFAKRRPAQELAAAKAAGLPDWAIKAALKLRELRWRVLHKKR